MTHAPLLITELERIRRERSWSVLELTRRIGVSRKLFYNMRGGHRPLSVSTLSEVARAFGSDYRVREAVMHYLALEYPTFGREILHDAKHRGRTAELPGSIAYHHRWRIVTWIGRLPFGEGVQRGLYLTAAKPETLSAVSRFIAKAVGDARVSVVTLAGNARPSASHAAVAREAAVLLVERIEYATEEVIALLGRRADAHRPVVVTSCVEREQLADAPLARILTAGTELIRLDGPMDARVPKTSAAPLR